MDLDIKESWASRLLIPYLYKSRTYHVLFFKQGLVGPFYVADSNFALENSLVTVGDIKHKGTDVVVGNMFYTTAKTYCGGSFLLAYSGVFKDSLNVSIPKDFSTDLVLKTKYLQIFNTKNRTTLIVSPSLKSSIRQNLEV